MVSFAILLFGRAANTDNGVNKETGFELKFIFYILSKLFSDFDPIIRQLLKWQQNIFAKIVFLLPSISFNNRIGEPFTEIIEVDSTNNYAMALARKGLASHGAAWFAHYQTAGKGQHNKQWKSSSKQNIILSVLLDMKWLPVSKQFGLSATIALGAYDFFTKYAGEKVTIKWPNDIYWNDRKAAGILIENVIRGDEWQYAVAGIGININQTEFDNDLFNPVSLKQITDNDYDVIALSKELCNCLEKRFLQFKNNSVNILSLYNKALYKRYKTIQLRKGKSLFSCIIREVNVTGQLIVNGASQKEINYGEVEWVL